VFAALQTANSELGVTVLVAAREVSRTFGSGHMVVRALHEVSFTVRRGQLVAVSGRSGSGKTTLLNIIGGLDRPTSGHLEVAGRDVTQLTERVRRRPDLLIADEPTSQLDLETGRQIMRLLLTVVRSEGITALVATHDEALMDLADDVLRLEDGRVMR
jgi:ABC-type lipoprotein export system ATPase subunit